MGLGTWGREGDVRDGDTWTLNIGTQGTLLFIASSKVNAKFIACATTPRVLQLL